MNQGVWNSELMCDLVAVRVINREEIALDLADNNCCDMSAAIRLARTILPGVRMIRTYAGGVPDTEYQLYGMRWEAFDRREVSV